MTGGLEIERKFLVDRLPADVERGSSRPIEQGYLAITPELEVRLRRDGPKALLTIKSSGSLVRVEEEFEIDQSRFTALWPLTEGRRVVKTRYTIPAAAGVMIELDAYAAGLAGLLTAEVEFKSEAAAHSFALPPWFGREVTDDPRYKNKELATHGLPGPD
jgi:CYTH domain-containing protein